MKRDSFGTLEVTVVADFAEDSIRDVREFLAGFVDSHGLQRFAVGLERSKKEPQLVERKPELACIGRKTRKVEKRCIFLQFEILLPIIPPHERKHLFLRLQVFRKGIERFIVFQVMLLPRVEFDSILFVRTRIVVCERMNDPAEVIHAFCRIGFTEVAVTNNDYT